MKTIVCVLLLSCAVYGQHIRASDIEVTTTLAGNGNVSLKTPSGDNIVYVSSSGNDSNDGLSAGTAKLTPQAGLNLATNSGAHPGTIYVSCGTFTGPTTYYQQSNVISTCALPLGNLCGNVLCGPNTANATTIFQYSSALTIGNPTTVFLNLYMRGIVFDFQNLGVGLTLQNVGSLVWDDVALYRCGDTATPCNILTTGTGSVNTSFNTFNRLSINPRADTTGHYATCLELLGTGSVLTGHIVTDNRWNDLKCVGQINDGIDFELNSDSNFINGFSGFQTLLSSPASDAWLAFNRNTPASDQDAGNGVFAVLANLTGSVNNLISMGTTTGPYISTQSGSATPSVTILGGGSPQYTLQEASLTAGTTPIYLTTGRIGAGAIATGQAAGQIASGPATNGGSFYVGSDGTVSVYRSGNNNLNLNVPASAAVNFQTAGSNGAVVGGMSTTCTMSSGTTCTASTPTGATHCIAGVQSGTATSSACSITGTTATVTAGASNSSVWLIIFTN